MYAIRIRWTIERLNRITINTKKRDRFTNSRRDFRQLAYPHCCTLLKALVVQTEQRLAQTRGAVSYDDFGVSARQHFRPPQKVRIAVAEKTQSNPPRPETRAHQAHGRFQTTDLTRGFVRRQNCTSSSASEHVREQPSVVAGVSWVLISNGWFLP